MVACVPNTGMFLFVQTHKEEAQLTHTHEHAHTCNLQETKPALVRYRYQSMQAGSHTLEFRAIAATEGVFVLPPVHAFADNQPEVMGTTASSVFTVCGGQHSCTL